MGYQIEVVCPNEPTLAQIERLVQTTNAAPFLGHPAGGLTLTLLSHDHTGSLTLHIEPRMCVCEVADWSIIEHR